MNNSSRYIDLSHTIEDGMITYKGIPGPEISDFLSRSDSRQYYTDGTEFHVGRIDMVANTGTYLDSPFHRYKEGGDLSEIKLEDVADIPGMVFRLPANSDMKIEASFFYTDISLKGMAVLIHTGYSEHWNSPEYFSGLHPFLTEEAAVLLASRGVKLVGIDSYNIDDIGDPGRPAHTILLGAGIYIIEHMTNLHSLPTEEFQFFAVPQKIKGMGSYPVRAFAIV